MEVSQLYIRWNVLFIHYPMSYCVSDLPMGFFVPWNTRIAGTQQNVIFLFFAGKE